jgi:glycosyltransferase involved in cell wall biosynthesis
MRKVKSHMSTYWHTNGSADRPRIRTGILAANPHIHGGVTSHVQTVFDALEQWGAGPEVIYVVTRPATTDDAAKAVTQAELLERFHGSIWALPYVRFPFLWTVTPILFAGRNLRQYDMLVCVCGSVHLAFSLALMKLPYVIWMGTLWEDELRAQIEGGDPHAARILAHPFYPLLKYQERVSLQQSRLIVTNSRHTANRVTQTIPELSSRVKDVTTPIDTDYFQPDEQIRAAPPYGEYLLFTARLNDPRKNVALLLQVFATLRIEFPALKLVLTGESPDANLQQKVRALNLEGSVIFTGYVSRDELRRLYQGALLYVLSSNQEGLGLVLLESMACGTPVVSTRCGGPEDIIQDGEVGYLVPTENAAELTNAVATLLRQPTHLQAMRERCVAYVQQHYSHGKLTHQFFKAMQTAFPDPMQHLNIPADHRPHDADS